jgi:hypothetical protein
VLFKQLHLEIIRLYEEFELKKPCYIIDHLSELSHSAANEDQDEDDEELDVSFQPF